MKGYFGGDCMTGVISIFDSPYVYELSVREEMRKLGATQKEYALLSQELTWNNFVKRRLPKDVAWAIMQ